MSQAIHDIRHMLDLAELLRKDAGEDGRPEHAAKLIAAAATLEQRAKLLTLNKAIAVL
jgi:hypothetical protein